MRLTPICSVTLLAALSLSFWPGSSPLPAGGLLPHPSAADGCEDLTCRDEILEPFVPIVTYLNELTERRRINVYFANEQPTSYGAQVGFVNVGRGNLTFVRRDLVIVGRLPLVLARVYDSSLEDGDFGHGWHLGAAEEIVPTAAGGFSYRDGAAALIAIAESDRRLSAAPGAIPDLVAFRRLSEEAVELRLSSGLVKTFTLAGGKYLLSRVEDANTNRIDLDYENGHLARLRGANDRELLIHRNPSGRVVAIEDELSRSVRYRYDGSGRLAQVVDAGGNRWRYSYDRQGRLITAANPSGFNHLEASYDEAGRVIGIRLPRGAYGLVYEPKLTAVTDAHGDTTLYRQDSEGRTIGIENALGVETRISLDRAGHPQRLSRNGITQASFRYSDDGRLLAMTRLEGERPLRLVYSHDRLGRLTSVTERLDSGPGTARLIAIYRYDERGNLVSRIDPEGERLYRYSTQGDLLETVAADGSRTLLEYNSDGSIVAVTDGEGHRTDLEYGLDGRLSRTRYAGGEVTTYHYNSLGMRRMTEYASGAVIRYEHSPAGSLTRVAISNAAGEISRIDIRLDEAQRVLAIESPLKGRRIAYTYDRMGNLISAVNARTKATLRLAYDPLNRLSEVFTPTGEHLHYEYAEGEPDLRIQLDDKSRINLAPRRSGAATFASHLELLSNRTRRSVYDAVVIDPSTATFRLANALGPTPVEHVQRTALDRLRLAQIGAGAPGARNFFDQPSNVIFIPPEYQAVNCCADSCDYILDLCECFDYPLPDCDPDCSPPPSPPPSPPTCVHGGTPNSGWLDFDSSLADTGIGYYHFLGSDAPNTDDWGCPSWIHSKIRSVGSSWNRSPRVGVGDISRQGGGSFPPHSSHQNGLDVDVRYVRSDSQESPFDFNTMSLSRYNQAGTQALITQFCLLGASTILVDARANLTGACVVEVPNHHNHFHVRYPDPDGGFDLPGFPEITYSGHDE